MVDLPLGATEDRVIGSIDFESAVKTGVSRFMPGLLARANRGVLYVDEVNLLDDHLVDAIVDAAESGLNIVEREGMSVSHPSRFVLIGTMNPEEGELRPQILDRFGLAVQVEAEPDPAARVELLTRREMFDLDCEGFEKSYIPELEKLRRKISDARLLLSEVFMPNHLRTFISEICAQNNVAGHRADIAMERAARAHAALRGSTEVSSDDIIAVAPLTLLHRARNAEALQMPPPPPEDRENDEPEDETDETPEEKTDEQPRQAEASAPPENEPGNQDESEETGEAEPEQNLPDQKNDARQNDDPKEEIYEIGEPFKVRKFASYKDKKLRTGSGRRSRTRSATKQGRYVRSTPRVIKNDLALDATLRAAAPFQIRRRGEEPENGMAVRIRKEDIREKVRERRVGNILIFLVDGSGSMGAQRRMSETKAAIMSLLLDAYQKRDRVCLIVFRGNDASVILPPTGSVDLAGKLLAELPIGGRTPLSAGLITTTETLTRILRKTPSAQPLVLVITDGKSNVGLGASPPHREALGIAAGMKERFGETRFVVIDTEPQGVVRFHLAGQLAAALNAEYFHPDTLKAEELVKIVTNGGVC
jgi:magnesium chelatase subunit D